jgi:anti-anti-sigma factor
MIQATCPSCARKFTVADYCAGRTQKCLKCGTLVEIPSLPAGGAGARDMAAAPEAGERDEIPLADDSVEAPPKPAPRAAPPSPNGLVMMPIQDITLVDFEHARILDAPVIEAIGRELYALVDKNARKKIILDFTKVAFLSSQMLGVIITLHKKAAAIQGKVVLCGLRPDLKKVFTMMKMEKLMPIVEMEGQAMEALGLHGAS